MLRLFRIKLFEQKRDRFKEEGKSLQLELEAAGPDLLLYLW